VVEVREAGRAVMIWPPGRTGAQSRSASLRAKVSSFRLANARPRSRSHDRATSSRVKASRQPTGERRDAVRLDHRNERFKGCLLGGERLVPDGRYAIWVDHFHPPRVLRASDPVDLDLDRHAVASERARESGMLQVVLIQAQSFRSHRIMLILDALALKALLSQFRPNCKNHWRLMYRTEVQIQQPINQFLLITTVNMMCL
jgi:hypothetical protein